MSKNSVTPGPQETPETPVAEIPTATPVLADEETQAPNPQEAIDLEDYEDPTPEEITDPDHCDYCEPASGIAPIEEDN